MTTHFRVEIKPGISRKKCYVTQLTLKFINQKYAALNESKTLFYLKTLYQLYPLHRKMTRSIQIKN
jgi:thiosulfate reductase cytochrome b subunit